MSFHPRHIPLNPPLIIMLLNLHNILSHVNNINFLCTSLTPSSETISCSTSPHAPPQKSMNKITEYLQHQGTSLHSSTQFQLVPEMKVALCLWPNLFQSGRQL
jgi:hypothetical protein